MYSEMRTQSKDEAILFLAQHLEDEVAMVTMQKTEDCYLISVGTGVEPAAEATTAP